MELEKRKIQNIQEQRLRQIAQLHRDCHAVWQWIQANRQQLVGEVYLPALEIKILATNTQQHHNTAKYLESSLPPWFLFGSALECPLLCSPVLAGLAVFEGQDLFCFERRPRVTANGIIPGTTGIAAPVTSHPWYPLVLQ